MAQRGLDAVERGRLTDRRDIAASLGRAAQQVARAGIGQYDPVAPVDKDQGQGHRVEQPVKFGCVHARRLPVAASACDAEL